MNASPAAAAATDRSAGPLQLGFLTVLNEANGYLGGYLVVNDWGRPLEFRLTSAVQPNRVQQVLYGDTLGPYICAELIGKTLVEKAGMPVRLVVTDRREVLDLRLRTDVPVAWLAPADAARGEVMVRPESAGRGGLFCHPRFGPDAQAVQDLLARLDATFDLAEPFQRIREAIGEARKMGVAAR